MVAALKAVEERVMSIDDERGGTVLAGVSAGAVGAEMLRDDVHAVADAEHGDAEVEDFVGEVGRAGIVEAGGTTGKDNAAGLQRADFLEGKVIGMDLAIDASLADAPSDELGVLAAKVENQDHENTLQIEYSRPRRSGEEHERSAVHKGAGRQ